jgi:hypothetical protein
MLIFLSASFAGTCTQTTLTELEASAEPGILVLGERKGTQPDLGRASRLVSRLRSKGAPVTVVLQAVSTRKQSVLDAFMAGDLEPDVLRDDLDWDTLSGFPFPPYQRLLLGAAKGDRLVAAGMEWEQQPKGTVVPRAPGYLQVLSDTMHGHFMPAELEPAFVQNVTWLDHRIATHAVENWNGKGFLVVVADRLHVEGGKGISWQLQRLVDHPVTIVNLAGPGGCYDGDRYLGP